jgi:hypothetical protein
LVWNGKKRLKNGILPCSVAGHDNESLISPFDDEISVERDAEIFVVDFWDVFDVDT